MLEKVFYVIGCFGLGLMSILMLMQVIARYVFNSPLDWPEELSLVIMVWITFIGAYLASIKDEHLNIDFVLNIVPNNFKKIFLLVTKLLVCWFLAVTILYGFNFILLVGEVGTPVIGISMWLVYGVIWLSCILMFMETLYRVVLDVKTFFNKERV